MPERIWFKQFHLDQLLPLASNACFNCKRASLSPEEAFSANHASGVATTCLQCKGISPYIAEHRGSNPPPSMMLSAVDKAGHVSTNLIRSWSFSLPELEDEIKRDIECKQLKDLGSCEMGEEQMPDTSHHPSSDVGSGLPK